MRLTHKKDYCQDPHTQIDTVTMSAAPYLTHLRTAFKAILPAKAPGNYYFSFIFQGHKGLSAMPLPIWPDSRAGSLPRSKYPIAPVSYFSAA